MMEHGGRLLAARRRFAGAPEPFIDLSTGINPEAYPFSPLAPEVWTRLPEPEAVAALEAVAARAYGVADPAMVVAAPGTQALIQLVPRVLPQTRVSVVGPTYGEHEAAWQAAGAAIGTGGAATVVCNPNNPDGRRHDPAELAGLAAGLELLVVDEAFADFEPGLSLAPLLPLRGVVVLRSFGKTYGLAGVRLGFALAEVRVARLLRRVLGPWAVGGPAIAIGLEALADRAWFGAAQGRAWERAVRLDGLLAEAGFAVGRGTALFRTVERGNAGVVAERLGRAGILVRGFKAQPEWLRFGLPGDAAAWERLRAGLAG